MCRGVTQREADDTSSRTPHLGRISISSFHHCIPGVVIILDGGVPGSGGPQMKEDRIHLSSLCYCQTLSVLSGLTELIGAGNNLCVHFSN